MRRVVITGFGIVSSIGKNRQEVLDSLLHGRSGITYAEKHKEMGFRSLVVGDIDIDFSSYFGRKEIRYMGSASAYASVAVLEALKMAGLDDQESFNERTGVVAGVGGLPSPGSVFNAWELIKEKKKTRAITPYIVPRAMASSVAAVLGHLLKSKGVNYSISSACSTSAHCIGHGYELIQFGKQDIVFAGGGEPIHWMQSAFFDTMKALAHGTDVAPEKASCPYDRDRSGFVISGGGGIVILEEYEHARARGANIIAELTGYGATSDGTGNITQPSGEGAERCMNIAKSTVTSKIDYINTHGTSTPIGDRAEARALRNIFKEDMPLISSTKSLTGHSLGAAGVHELIYGLIMMQNDFLCASHHIENLDPDFENMPILRENQQGSLNTIMSNSFGFGGTNAALVFEKFKP